MIVRHRVPGSSLVLQVGLLAAFLSLSPAWAHSPNESRRAQLVPLVGAAQEVMLTGIDAQGHLLGDGVARGLTIDQLRQVTFLDSAPVESQQAATVLVRGGGRLKATAVTLADEECVVQTASGTFSFPLEALQAVRFDPKSHSPLFERLLKDPLPAHDRMIVQVDDQQQAVQGLIESISADQIAFQYQDKSRQLPRKRIRGIVFAKLENAPDPKAPQTITLADGSVLAGKISQADRRQLDLTVADSAPVTVGWNQISQISIRSNRMTFLSDMNPTEAEQTPVVTVSRPWQRDRSVDGNPLRLLTESGKQVRQFDKGLGTQSMCRLVFSNDDDFDRFAATLGIDAETSGRGDCLFQVYGDGRKLFERRVRGQDEPYELVVDITGMKQISLIVQPGQGLDLSDHANWCDARFLRLTNKDQ